MTSVMLRTFLASGSLGPVGVGVDRVVVESSFGPPDDFDARAPNPRVAAIWRYGDVELHFDRDKVWLIHIDRFSGSGGSPKAGADLDLDPWVIVGGLSLDDFADALKQSGLQHTILLQPDLSRTVVTFPSCVHVGFSGVIRERARLELISRAIR